MNSFTAPPPLQPLCDSHGNLDPAAIGWSNRPLDCRLPAHFGRRKRWNQWCISTPHWILSLTLADFDYLGYAALYFLDLDSGHSVRHSQRSLLGRGCQLPDNALQSQAFNHPRLQIEICEYPGRLNLTAAALPVGGIPLRVELDIQRPPHVDHLNLTVPFPGGGFHALSRHLALPAAGGVQWGERQHACVPGQSFAALDFGRGVWPLHSHWTRAALVAPGGIAGNFGSGWTDQSSLSENALWFGGALQPLQGPIRLTQSAPGPRAVWRLSDEHERVALTFTPRQHYEACPRLGPFYARTAQWFGQYDGLLRGAQGERVPVQGALGWLGTGTARW